MNLEPLALAELHALLRPIDAADAAVEGLAAPTEAARSAAARLQAQLVDVDQQIAATVIPPIAPIPAGPDRIEALIAGIDVQKIDPEDVVLHSAAAAEAAVKVRPLNVERQQIAADLSAVQQRITQLEIQASGFHQQRWAAWHVFIVALGDALHEAYRRDVTEFVRTHVPPMLSVGHAIGRLTGGKVPAWHINLSNCLVVTFPDQEYVPAVPFGAGRLLYVWPRPDGTLISGEPSSSPGIVDDLTEAIRASGDQAEASKRKPPQKRA